MLPSTLILLNFSFLKKRKVNTQNVIINNYGIIITAYKDIDICQELLESLALIKDVNLNIYLIADRAHSKFSYPTSDNVEIIYPKENYDLKLKSILRAYEASLARHDFYIIFDSDNVVDPKYFEDVEHFIKKGFSAIQSRRVAKKINSNIAGVDAIGEIYKNYIDRKVLFELGSSSTLSGSGICLSKELLNDFLNFDEVKDNLENRNALIAEDKILQNFIVSKGHRIAYAWYSLVYDAKVDTSEKVVNQRSRWLFAYFQNIKSSIMLIIRGLLKFDFNKLLFGLASLSPPLILLGMFSFLLLILNLFLNHELFFLLLLSGIIFTSGILLSVKLSGYSNKIFSSVMGLPLFVVSQFLGLLKLRKKDNYFESTDNKDKE